MVGSRATAESSPSPLRTQWLGSGRGCTTLNAYGEPGSATPSSDTATVNLPEVCGLYSHVYVPSSLSRTLEWTNAEPRSATKNLAPPLWSGVPSASLESIVNDAACLTMASDSPVPSTLQLAAAGGRSERWVPPRTPGGACGTSGSTGCCTRSLEVPCFVSLAPGGRAGAVAAAAGTAGAATPRTGGAAAAAPEVCGAAATAGTAGAATPRTGGAAAAAPEVCGAAAIGTSASMWTDRQRSGPPRTKRRSRFLGRRARRDERLILTPASRTEASSEYLPRTLEVPERRTTGRRGVPQGRCAGTGDRGCQPEPRGPGPSPAQ